MCPGLVRAPSQDTQPRTGDEALPPQGPSFVPLPWCTIKCLFLPLSLAFLTLTGVQGAEGGFGTKVCFYSHGCWLRNLRMDIQFPGSFPRYWRCEHCSWPYYASETVQLRSFLGGKCLEPTFFFFLGEENEALSTMRMCSVSSSRAFQGSFLCLASGKSDVCTLCKGAVPELCGEHKGRSLTWSLGK